jgi:hypothetical protein
VRSGNREEKVRCSLGTCVGISESSSGSQNQRNQSPENRRNDGRKSLRKKNQNAEEGRKTVSELREENGPKKIHFQTARFEPVSSRR